jgi:hypothetical protein
LCVFVAAPCGDASAATARVQYVSAANVYLDAGETAGLKEGAFVAVTREGKEIARLTVVFVADHSAACRVESATQAIRVGDSCVFAALVTAVGSAGTADSAAGGAASDSAKAYSPGLSGGRSSVSRERPAISWPQAARVRGRITSLYTKTSDAGGTYHNPSLFADLAWIGGGMEQGTLRVRATRPSIRAVTDLPGTERRESSARLYEAALGYRSQGGRIEFDAGRILPRRLEGIGYVDGAALRLRAHPDLSFGFSGGRGSDLGVAGFSGRGSRLGAYLETGNPASTAPRRLRAFLGGTVQRDSALIRRSYLVQRADLGFRRGTTVFQTVEADLNPRWKRDLGEWPASLTAWSLGSSVRILHRASVTATVDSRRGVLVPEQRSMPAAPKPDRYSGVHATSRLEISRETSVYMGGDLRRRERDGQRYSSWNAGISRNRLGYRALSGGLHAMGYQSEHMRGLSGDASLAARFSPWIDADLAGGLGGTKTDWDATLAPPYRSRWVRAGASYRSPIGLWASLSHEWRTGGPGSELSVELGASF